VANWITAYTNQLPPAEVPNTLRTAELEERYTLVGKKKTKSIS
jgi:hypothetical protein